MGRIRVLPESVINTIAAGEVVERPASVVKELIENALDAGASTLTVRIEEGGSRLVEILDDGSGMDGDDAISALERHATSKLAAGMELEAIETLGFRGEALPSIAAVSRLTLVTSAGGAGTRVEAEGGVIRSAGPAPHPRGTTVSVRDLFYNTPARRRFLRSRSTEMAHILELFTAICLSRPGLRFRLDHGSRRVFDLPAAIDLRARLAQIEGAESARASVEILAGGEGCRVSGFIVAGGAARQQGARRLVVNDRVVRDRLVLRALSRAVEEALPKGTPYACFLNLDLPRDRVDVNVHPAKAEVRFREPGAVYRTVEAAVGDALRSARPVRALPQPAGAEAAAAVGFAAGDGPAAAVREAVAGAAERWFESRSRARPLWESHGAPTGAPTPGVTAEAMPRGDAVVLGHYRSGYILAEDAEGLLIVDQHAAHERILFERLSASEAGRAGESQALLFPRTVQPPAALRGETPSLVADLLALGFEAEEFGDGTIVVRAVPAPLSESDPAALVLGVLQEVASPGRDPEGIEARRRRMVASAACHAAVKVPAHLTPEKLEWIVSTLLACRFPLQCPHGRPTILRWPHRDLERRFGRP